MTYRDAIRCRMSLERAEMFLSPRHLRRFLRLWTWSSLRLGGAPGRELDAWYERRGAVSYRRKQQRTQRVITAIMNGR